MFDPDKIPKSIVALIDSFFADPVKLDRNGHPHDIRRSALSRREALILAALVYNLRPRKSLEIGLGEAASCVAISAARRCHDFSNLHIALDPFEESDRGGAGLLELERLGLREVVNWYPETSESYLHDTLKRGETDFDFCFVDGGHQVGQKLTDAFYVDKLLRLGGVVAFHDGLLISTAAAMYFLLKERGYTLIRLPADDPRRRLFRSVKHGLRLGWWYSTRVIPAMCRSLVALKKPVSEIC